jgi:O-glycosyl hydrolase
MNSALWMARRLHEDLTIGGVSAWHYWWLVPRSDTADTNAALLAQGALTRRAYALGNYSKFVRPGAHRLATSATRQGVLVTAFQNAAAPELVIVAVNLKSEPVTHSFDVAGVALGDVTPWLTSATAALEEQAPIAGAASFSYELPASSVVTFVASVQ